MKIGELAAATGLAASAIRFYEQSGLLPAAQRTDNGYRSYADDAVDRLRFIQVSQALGFSLDSLRSLFVSTADFSETELRDELLQRVDARLGEIDHMLATLRTQRKDLHVLRERMVASWAEGECLDPASVELTPVQAPAPRARRVTRAPVAAPAPARKTARR